MKIISNVNEFVKKYTAKDQNIKILFHPIENHFAMLAKNFRRYFVTNESLKAEWVRGLFQKSLEEQILHINGEM